MKLYLIAKTCMEAGLEQFLSERGLDWHRDVPGTEPELVAEFAGRVCYMSFGELQSRRTTRVYLENILRAGHGSVLEHATFTLLADGISRSLSHQLVRHRVGFSYSQLSQQYHDESGASFVEPEGLDEDPSLRARWERWRQESLALYADLQRDPALQPGGKSGVSTKEQSRRRRARARLVLPNATATSLVITGNTRAWRHVLCTRGNIVGDLEMRAYCIDAYRLLSQAAPNLFLGFELAEDELGLFVRTVGI
jgi:thymidylate synthase (FAD)